MSDSAFPERSEPRLTASAALPARERLASVVEYVSRGLVERDEQARVLVLAALCGEHLLLLGPPGTAKSELARRLHRVFGGRYFERLLTRFTVPEELFGPLSLAALDEGRYERDVEGYLPTASVAFLDEVFKANSAILNALLTVLNEREFDQGPLRIATPLVSVVAASNEVPDDESLRAFHDRFLFRCPVAPVGDERFAELLAAGEPGEARGPQLSAGDIDAVAAGLGQVALPRRIGAALLELRAFLREQSIEVSDRRWVRIARALKVSALTNGRRQVELDDLYLLRFLVPERPEQVEALDGWYAARLGADEALDPQRLERVAQAFEKQVEIEQSASELAFDDSGKLAMVRKVGGADAGQMTADSAPRLSAFSRRRRFGATHVRARLAQIDEALAEVDAFLSEAAGKRERIVQRLRGHLWVAPAFATRVAAVLDETAARVAALRARLQGAREAFAALPLADEDDGRVPPPVGVAA